MKLFAGIALFATLSFAAIAQTIELPRVSAPAELSGGEFAEGTITRLNAAEVAEFLPWAQNARNTLNRAITQARALPLRERLPHIERAVKNVVNRSGNRQYQMLMRFSLNRGLLLVDELERHVDMGAIGSQESALDLLQRAISVCLSFYESDLTFQQRAQNGSDAVVIPHARFAAAFMQGMYPGVVNVLDATAQYRLLYKLIEMVNWDLSRDAEAPRYAESIVEAYEMGQDLPSRPEGTDKANLRLIRRLNSLKLINLRSAGSAAAAENRNEADLPISSVLSGNRGGVEYGPGVDPNRAVVTCTTTTNGLEFKTSSRDSDFSFRDAIAKCTSDSRTNNNECRANIACSDRQNAPFMRCETTTNGLTFSSETRDRDLSYRQTLSSCKSDSRTNDNECNANVTCRDGQDYPRFVRCETTTNGLTFSSETRDRELSYRQALSRCTGDSRTNNKECNANVTCNDGQSYPRFVRCSTSSQGLEFTSETRDRDLSYGQAISRCTGDSRTNNGECQANWTCR